MDESNLAVEGEFLLGLIRLSLLHCIYSQSSGIFITRDKFNRDGAMRAVRWGAGGGVALSIKE